MSEKYVIVTMANIAPENRAEVLGKLPALVDESRAAGSSRAGVGVMLTGSVPGAVLMFQMVDELNKIENIYSAFSTSATYKSLLAGGVNVVKRNIASIQLSHTFSDQPNLKYTVMTRGSSSADPEKVISLIDEASALFRDNGAQTMRFGRIMTGDNVGDYLLGISYESLAQVEATYDAIAKSPLAAQIYSILDVNARSITQLLAIK